MLSIKRARGKDEGKVTYIERVSFILNKEWQYNLEACLEFKSCMLNSNVVS